MNDTARPDREDALRADAARLVQAMRHHLPESDAPPTVMPLLEAAGHLAGLLEADAPIEHVQEAALAVVDAYDWPGPESGGGGEGPVIDAAIMAPVERLRDAIDALDELNDDS